MPLLFIFIAVPLIEIALFVRVGGAIGLGWTLFIVVATAVVGTRLIRTQGAGALSDLRSALDELRDPVEPLAHGALILFSGALLLTPGFFTDAVGLALLFPPVRRALIRQARARVTVEGLSPHGGIHRPADGGNVIDGEFEEVDPPGHRAPDPAGARGKKGH